MQKPQKLILSVTLALGLATIIMSTPVSAKIVTGFKGAQATGNRVVVPAKRSLVAANE
ncbi:hypothetical protein [Pseudanabaena sp. ABRG5-3]|uniref:hypothetical protein n=1 Tax=Pseudanabaena sp. ABRG5-3 TaxID=685565 RepID=UPI0013A6211A|nr:hypothetical protein [Pseudanabaena sp. ABRG5-3]